MKIDYNTGYGTAFYFSTTTLKRANLSENELHQIGDYIDIFTIGCTQEVLEAEQQFMEVEAERLRKSLKVEADPRLHELIDTAVDSLVAIGKIYTKAYETSSADRVKKIRQAKVIRDATSDLASRL